MSISCDEIKKLNIKSLYKLENKTLSNIYELKNKDLNIDLVYLKYNNFKMKIKNEITYNKRVLNNINEKKDEFKNKEEYLNYLINEYNILFNINNSYKNITKIKKLIYEIKNINNNVSNQLNSIYNKYNKLLNYLSNEKKRIPKNLTYEEKINWYKNALDEEIKKRLIIDDIYFSLEFLLKNAVKQMLDFKFV